MNDFKSIRVNKIWAIIVATIIVAILALVPLAACSGENNKASEDLEFTLMGREGYYVVSGIGECTDSDVVIPDSYEGLPVQGIYMMAFKQCKSITSIYIPDSVTYINSYAFYGCSNLQSVVIGSGVTSIGSAAFLSCPALYSVTFKNTEGWSAGSTELDSTSLSDTLVAATYLAETYVYTSFKNEITEEQTS